MNAHSYDRAAVQSRAPLRERLVAVRRDHILDAATEVFAAKGFEAATIREIAHLAGVADGTIYTYFKNKAALLLGIMDRLNETEQRREHLTAPEGAKLVDFVRAYMHHRFDIFGQVGFDAFRVLFGELLINAELRDQYRRETLEPTFNAAEGAVRGWLASSPPEAIDPALGSHALAGLVVGTLLLRLLDDRVLVERWNEVPDVLAHLLVFGLVPEDAAGAPPDAPDAHA
jgi:TetR/AcrR family transcriptional regulator, fatty acid metabolism regulator protein